MNNVFINGEKLMVIIKCTGMTIKRSHTPLCEIFATLNTMYHQNIIGGYLVTFTEDNHVVINIIERG